MVSVNVLVYGMFLEYDVKCKLRLEPRAYSLPFHPINADTHINLLPSSFFNCSDVLRYLMYDI